MRFEFYIKYGQKYIKKELEVESSASWKWFKSLKMTIEDVLDIVRNDILSYFKDKKKVKLSKPVHDDWATQQKINKLIKIRRHNNKVKQDLIDLLSTSEFIMCKCGAKMYKTPINVGFYKIGTRYIITEDMHGQKPKNAFMCESCYRMIEEEIYNKKQDLKDERKKLIKKGYNWVPNDFGFWYHYGDDPLNKSPEMRDKEVKSTI